MNTFKKLVVLSALFFAFGNLPVIFANVGSASVAQACDCDGKDCKDCTHEHKGKKKRKMACKNCKDKAGAAAEGENKDAPAADEHQH